MKQLRSLFALQILLLLSSPLAWAGEPKIPAEELSRLVATAVANNPELRSSQARWQMFRNRIAQARSLDDPMLMLKIQSGLVNSPLNFRRDGMTQKVIGLSQQIPFWGKRAIKEEMAAKDAESYRWQAEERRLELVRMVKETYYRIYFVDRSLEVVAKNIRILDDFVVLTETKYSVGQGMQQDVFKSQVERSKMLDMQISLEQERKSLEATLNALLFRPQDSTLGRIPDFEIKPQLLLAGELREKAFEKRPLLKSLQAQIEKGAAGHRLARKEFYPDFNVSLEYMQREPAMESDGADMYSLGVTFNLPLQRERRHAMLAESNSEVGMATEELNGLKNTIDSAISDLLAKLEKREKLVQLYKSGIIPQAGQSLESATIGYRVNKVDFLSLLDSRVTLFNNERELYESQAEYMMTLAQLEAVVGVELLSSDTNESQRQ
jgi:outer membrane protein TolC